MKAVLGAKGLLANTSGYEFIVQKGLRHASLHQTSKATLISVLYCSVGFSLFICQEVYLRLLISNLEEGRDQRVPYSSLLIKRYFDGKCMNISHNQIIELNLPELCAY